MSSVNMNPMPPCPACGCRLYNEHGSCRGDDLADTVEEMRRLQVEYFKTRDRGILERSKEMERRVDRLISSRQQGALL